MRPPHVFVSIRGSIESVDGSSRSIEDWCSQTNSSRQADHRIGSVGGQRDIRGQNIVVGRSRRRDWEVVRGFGTVASTSWRVCASNMLAVGIQETTGMRVVSGPDCCASMAEASSRQLAGADQRCQWEKVFTRKLWRSEGSTSHGSPGFPPRHRLFVLLVIYGVAVSRLPTEIRTCRAEDSILAICVVQTL